MPDYLTVARLPLPADWTPENVVCALVPLPDDPEYLAHLVGIIDLLRNSRTFARDATKTGAATVARTWVSALNTRPVLIGDCEQMEYLLRDDPTDPCSVQQSTDGGETWTHAFTKDDCDGPVYTPPPLDGNPEAPAAAAGNALRNIYIGLLELIGDCTMTRAQYIDAATAYMRLADATFSNPVALGDLYDAYCSMDAGDQDAAKDECTYADNQDELASCYDAGGLLTDLQCLSDTISDWLNTASDELQAALANVAGALGLGGWQSFSSGAFSGGGGGAGGGGGFASQCGWCHEFDYTVDPHNTFPHAGIVIEAGQYTAGGYMNDGSGQLWFRYAFDGLYTITYMEMDFTSSGGIHIDNEFVRINTQHGTFVGAPFSPYGDNTSMHMVHTGGGTIGAGHQPLATGYVQIQIQGWSDELQTTWPDITVTRWKVCGEGPDPFV